MTVRPRQRQPELLIGGIVLTLAALVGTEWLPARTLRLTDAGVISNRFLQLPAASDNVGTPVRWVDEERLHWHCHYTRQAAWQPCGLTLVLGEDPVHGRDLSRFDRVEMDLKYNGPAPFVRIALRNFDPRFSRAEDGNSARIQSLNLRPRDLSQPVSIELDELTVPEWWVQQFDLPREYIRPSVENVTTLTIDLPSDLTGQAHDLALRGLVLRGDWVRRDQVYLAILAGWLLAATLVALRHWHQLRQVHDLQQREIDALTARARTLRVEQEKLRRLATIDDLTGVLNRRGLEQALDDFEEACQGMTVLMMDVDHFKQINDRHGHDGGDEVLRRITAIIVSNLRQSDVVGRWGGEEFLIACRGTRVKDAARLAEKLRERIETAEIHTRAGRIEVTASFGVAMAAPAMPAAGAVKRADDALYAAKHGGRNRVEVDTSLQSDSPTTV